MNDLLQASRKNWSAYAWAAGIGLVILIFIVWLAVSSSPKRETKVEELSARSTLEKMPDRSFLPPPPPLPAPTPAATPAVVEKMPPKPPAAAKPLKTVAAAVQKPMTTMFVTTEETKAVNDQKKDEKVGQPAIDSGIDETRPGNSESVQWLNNAGTKGKDFVVSPYLPPMGRYVLQAGTIIPATLLNSVNSDLPGDIIAMINEDVRDTATGQYILIPATSRLYGRYNAELRYGQSRAQIAWNRILFPDASSQNIGSMSGTDASGAAGIEGDVDHHTWSMAGAIGLSAFMSIIGQAGTIVAGDKGTTNIGSIGAEGAGRETQSIGREFVTRELDRPNTLSLAAGTQVAVMLSKDVITLVPYGSRGAVDLAGNEQ